MSKKILHMRDPLVNTYTSYGILFSITNDTVLPWVFNNFIQIRYAPGWKMFAFDNHQLLLSNCPAISYFEVPREIIERKWNRSLKDMIIECIELNLYLFFYIDRFYLPNWLAYLNNHEKHEIFVFGYDSENDQVYIADNLQNGKFIQAVCKFGEIEESYWALAGEQQFLTNIRFLQPKNNTVSSFNIEQVKSGLKSYHDSLKTLDLVIDQACDFGFASYSILNKELDLAMESGTQLAIRTFHLLYEHKLLMEMRLEYMIRNGFLSDNSGLLNKFSLLKQDFLELRNRAVKYNLTHKKEKLSAIIDDLNKLLKAEKELIGTLIDLLT